MEANSTVSTESTLTTDSDSSFSLPEDHPSLMYVSSDDLISAISSVAASSANKKTGAPIVNSTITVAQPRRKKKANNDHDLIPRPDEVSDSSYDSEKEKEIIRERLKDTGYVARKYGKPVTNIVKLRIKPKRVKKNKEMGPPPPAIAPPLPRLSETTSDDNQTPKRAWMQEQNKRERSSMATTATVTSKLPAKKVKGRVSTLSLKDHIASTVSSTELDLPLSQDPATKRIIRRSSTMFQPRKLNASMQSSLQTSNLSQGSKKSSQSDVGKSALVAAPPPPEPLPAPEAPPSGERDLLNTQQKSAKLPAEGDEEMGIESNLEEGPVVDENSEGATEDDFEFEKSQFAVTPKKPPQRRSSVVPSSRQRDTDTGVESDKEPVVEPSTTKTGTKRMTSRQASLRSSAQKGQMVSPPKKQRKAADSASAVAPSPYKKSFRISSSCTSTSGASPKSRNKRKTLTMPKSKGNSVAKKRLVEIEEEASAADEYEVLEGLDLEVAKTPNKTSRSSVHLVNEGRQSIAPNLKNHSTNLQISPIINERRKSVVPVDNMNTDTESDEEEEDVALITKTGAKKMSTNQTSNVSSQNHRQSQPPLKKRKAAQAQQVVEADSVVEEPVVATKKAKAIATGSKTQGKSKVSSRPSLSTKRQQQQPKKKKRQVLDKETEESDDSEASFVSQEEHSVTPPPALNRTGTTHNSAHILKPSTSTSRGATLKGKNKQQPAVTKPKSKGQKKEPEWGPNHPFMQGPGKVFYNDNLASASLLKSSLDKYSPDVKLTEAQEKTLLKNVNSYIEKTLDKLCDNAPMEYGTWSFKQLMSKMKKDGLMEEDETEEDFVAAMKDAVGEETANKAEGWIVPKKRKNDTLDIYL